MNRFQEKTPPGDPLAVKRGYCICTGHVNVHHDASADTTREHWNYKLTDPDCPLHGSNPTHNLPDKI